MNEADTCRRLVVPKLQAAGWETEPHSIAEQRTITDGRIVPAGKGFIRRPDDVWKRYRTAGGPSEAHASQLLTPFNHAVGKGERY